MIGPRPAAAVLLACLSLPCRAQDGANRVPSGLDKSTGSAVGAQAPRGQALEEPTRLVDLSGATRALKRASSAGFPWASDMPLAPAAAGVKAVRYRRAAKIVDPLIWLEKPGRADTKAWVKAENRATRAYLDSLKERRGIRRELAETTDFELYGQPSRKGDRYAYFKSDAAVGERSLYVADKLYGPARKLIDPREFNKEGTASIAGSSFSPDGKLVAYAIRRDGSDWAEWRVRDVATGKDLPDHLKWTFQGDAVVWSPKGSGFYYERYKPTKPGEKYTGVKESTGTFFHALGTSQADDKRLSYGEVSFAQQGGLLLLDQGDEFFFQKTADNNPKWFKLVGVKSSTSSFELVGSVGERFYFLTDVNAKRRRLIAVERGKPDAKDWQVIIPEGERVLAAASIVRDRLAATWSDAGIDSVKLYDLEGKPKGEVKLPGKGAVSGFRKWREGFGIYTFTSFTQPATAYRYNFETGRSTAFRPPKENFEPEQFVEERIFYPSKDGTLILLDLVYRKGLKRDGKNTVYLHGYGGFGVTLEPGFEAEQLAWTNMGGVYAVAHLRGGGEYGQDWHDAGRLQKKQNVFDDFIAAAEWLIDEKYTSPEKLAIGGGSNGGLLAAAVMLQRPDLFGAVVPQVGVMDMMRFDKATVGAGWQSDYGDADKKKDFKTMGKYSPYHNVKERAYPATLIMTSTHDDRVVPSHSYKFGAVLQASQKGDANILIRTQNDAGHGGSVSWKQWLSAEADRLAFLMRSLGPRPSGGAVR